MTASHLIAAIRLPYIEHPRDGTQRVVAQF